MPQARCMKCKKQVEVKNPEETIMKNGMKAVKGQLKVYALIAEQKFSRF